MIIEPDLINHPKFIQLKMLIGDVAMEILVKLWSHCQQNKRGQFWRGATENYLNILFFGKKTKKHVFAALRDCGWIAVHADGIEIHDWNKHNASLIARWARETHPAQPLSSLCAASAKSTTLASAQTPTQKGQDRTGQDRTGEGGRTPPLAACSDREEPVIPTSSEFKVAFLSIGIPDDYLDRQFEKFHESRAWLNARSELVDWVRIVRNRWKQDREKWIPKKNLAPSSETIPQWMKPASWEHMEGLKTNEQ